MLGNAALHRPLNWVHSLVHHLRVVHSHSWRHVLVVVVVVVHRRVERMPVLWLGVGVLLGGWYLTLLIFFRFLQVFRNGSLYFKLITVVVDNFLVDQVHRIVFVLECDVTESCLFLLEHEIDLSDRS